jgi:hypothetical protein
MMGESSHGSFQHIIQAFFSSKWGNPWKSSVRIVCTTVKIQTGHEMYEYMDNLLFFPDLCDNLHIGKYSVVILWYV